MTCASSTATARVDIIAEHASPAFVHESCFRGAICDGIYIDYFMVGERVRFLFTSCEESQTNERVFDRVSLRFFTTSE